MKDINNHPCETCDGSYCDRCQFFHAEKAVPLPSNGEENPTDGVVLDYEESEYLDPFWDDDFDY